MRSRRRRIWTTSKTPPDIYAVFPSRRGLSPKVRAFVDFLVEVLRPG